MLEKVIGKSGVEEFRKFWNKKLSLEDFKKIISFGILLALGVILFNCYLKYVTFDGELKGEKILYVKIDGSTGAVQKVNNKYLGKQSSIKNTKNLSYGYYLMRFDVKKVVTKKGFTTIEGKIKGYKESKLNNFRRYILNIFDDLFMTEENLYAFSRAAVLGEKSEVSKDMKDKFKYTGLAHLIVISGTHISLVVIGIVKILDTVNLAYKWKYIFSLIALTLYCTLVGMSPGILRAYIMGAMMILARILFQQEDSKKSLMISLIVILVLNPYAITDISMQLSYAAVVAIIFVYPHIERIINIKFLEKMENGILKDSLKLTILSLCIQIVSMPLFLYYFEKLPLFSFLLNIIGVPIGTVLIEALFSITLLNILKIKLLNFIFVPVAQVIYNAFEGFIFMGSKIPMLQLNVAGKIDLWMVFVYYILLVVGVIFVRNVGIEIEDEIKKVKENIKKKKY